MRQHWIGGRWARGKRAAIPVVDPATEEVLERGRRSRGANYNELTE